MSHNLTLAQNHAFDLARTLMVPVVLFEVDDEFGVMVSSEYDGEENAIVLEVAPVFEVGLQSCQDGFHASRGLGDHEVKRSGYVSLRAAHLDKRLSAIRHG